MDWRLLRAVSRSFYLTIRLLPAPVRETIALGYLLARASDSIADTSGASIEARRSALDGLLRGEIDTQAVAELAKQQIADAERVLVGRLPELIALAKVSPDRERLEWVWERILRGQLFDLTRFDDRADPLSPEELDEYTFLVAGCVGEFWTRLCADRLPGFSKRDSSEMTADAIRYGKGLQLVNILRDRAADAANGRIYVPAERFDEVRCLAFAHLDAGWRWVRAVNVGRVRFACVIPLRIGGATLARCHANSGPVKIRRAEVRRILLGSLPTLWQRP